MTYANIFSTPLAGSVTKLPLKAIAWSSGAEVRRGAAAVPTQREHREHVGHAALVVAQEHVDEQHHADRGREEDLRGGGDVDSLVHARCRSSQLRLARRGSSSWPIVASIASTSGAGHTPTISTATASTISIQNSRRSRP